MGVAAQTSSAITPAVTVSGLWTATLVGPVGVVLVVHFDLDAGATSPIVEARMDQAWTGDEWIVAVGTLGVRVNANNGAAPATVAELEAELGAFIVVAIHDPAPSSEIDMDAMGGQEMALPFALPEKGQLYAGMLAALLPPGKLWRLVPGASTLFALLEGCADELSRLDARVSDLLTEIDPRTSIELVPDSERELGLAVAPTLDERRARVITKTLQNQGARPDDFRQELAPLLAQEPADVVVIERSVATAAALGDAREIYAFFIYRDPTLPGTYFLASAQEHVNATQPDHTIGTVIESIDALYDDPHTLYDRDILGA